eukprot:COSAG02_NODE_7393_length_3036_cov_3.215186_3_plen_143_part_00
MEHIARIMALDHSVHECERDAFMVQIATFDAHQNAPHMDINMHLGNFNTDLEALHTDLVALNLWDATTIVSISDFGRTITSNGIGTDHGIILGAARRHRLHFRVNPIHYYSPRSVLPVVAVACLANLPWTSASLACSTCTTI